MNDSITIALIVLLSQAPFLLVFSVVLYRQEKARQQSIAANHVEWRNWLVGRDERDKAWWAEQGETWRQWVHELSDTYTNVIKDIVSMNRDERAGFLRQLGRLDTGLMLIYATQRGQLDKAAVLEEVLLGQAIIENHEANSNEEI